MTMGYLTAWNGIQQGEITTDDGQLLPVHIACMPFARSISPRVGLRLYCDVVRDPDVPPFARSVWAVIDGSKPTEEAMRAHG